jgi:nuclear pore complex protein Nup205
LGSPNRSPGFEPYLSYVIDSVLTKFPTRIYKDRKEMWKIAGACLDLLHELIVTYPTIPDDFEADEAALLGSSAEVKRRAGMARGPGAGYLVMRRTLVGDGELVRVAMYVVEECVQVLDKWEDFGSAGPLLEAGLSGLKFLSACLDAQGSWQAMYRDAMARGRRAFPVSVSFWNDFTTLPRPWTIDVKMVAFRCSRGG